MQTEAETGGISHEPRSARSHQELEGPWRQHGPASTLIWDFGPPNKVLLI